MMESKTARKVGRPAKPDYARKTDKIVVFLTPEEKLRIESIVQRGGYDSASHYMRCKGLGLDPMSSRQE